MLFHLLGLLYYFIGNLRHELKNQVAPNPQRGIIHVHDFQRCDIPLVPRPDETPTEDFEPPSARFLLLPPDIIEIIIAIIVAEEEFPFPQLERRYILVESVAPLGPLFASARASGMDRPRRQQRRYVLIVRDTAADDPMIQRPPFHLLQNLTDDIRIAVLGFL